MGATESKHWMTRRILAICAAIVVLIGALFIFMNANTNRIVQQNGEYLETSTGQTARRVNDMLANALRSVQTSASIFESSLTSPEVDPEQAIKALDFSQLDHTFFITPDGEAYSHDGDIALATDKEYFTEGIEGESGMCFIEDSIFDGQNIVAFYSPVRYDNEIVGILVSVYREDTLTSLMTTQFYGQATPTYLCDANGTIIAYATPTPIEGTNINDIFSGEELEGTSLDALDTAISQGETMSFTTHASEGIGNTYVTKLPSFDWAIVRSFPPSVTNSMVSKANLSGTILIVGVLLAAFIVAIVLLLQARKQKQQLLLEGQRATRIIDASTNLFSSLLSIDLLENTYEFLKNDGFHRDFSPTGSYNSLRTFFEDIVDPTSISDGGLVFLTRESISEALPVGVPFVQQEWRTKGSEETALWYQISTLCLARDGAGAPTGVLVTVQDVTDVKAQELASHQALEDAFKAAEHASKAKSDFLNSMSHDIRTPMNSIMGLTAIASMHVNDPDRVRECLTNITSASRHLLGLINEVLDMAKIESGAIGLSEEAFDLPETIENLITIINPQIAANKQELKIDLGTIKHEHVLGDPTRLQQVFVNIMGNSIKFTPEGGLISLRINELPSRIPGSGCYEFIFSDTGCGMSPEFLKTVFEPFTRANDSRTTKIEGTGLGMSIVKSVVSLMSGTIDVESEEGVGTTFTVTVHLKLRDGAAEDYSDLQDINVLVVDDDPIACEGACMLLTDIGMRSHYVLSGQAGIDAVVEAESAHDPYQAVILDWRMPGMSGIETAKAIREVSKENVPIIILSAYDWSMIEQEAREIGVDAFISKPLFKSRLVQVMKDLLTDDTPDVMDERSMLEGLALKGRRVLLAEDNVMAAAIAQELIELTGAEVEHAENGKLAWQMLLEHEPGYYDIVLMDIQMPIMNGYEATKAIRAEAEQRPDMGTIPIIALSADAFADDIKQSRSSGMNDHMAKPLEIDILVSMLNKWVPKDK